MQSAEQYINGSKDWDIRKKKQAIAEEYGKELVAILNEYVSKAGQGNFYIRSTVMAYDDDKYQTHVNVYFDHEGATHESWYQEGYPDGVDLIIILNNGYHADGQVWTYDHDGWGNKHYSRQQYAGAHFVEAAIEEFNRKYSSVVEAEYDKDLYK